MNYPTQEQIDAVLARARPTYGADTILQWTDYGPGLTSRMYWLGQKGASRFEDALEVSPTLDGLAAPPAVSPRRASPARAYLGDGCYVDFDGYALVLTTSDGSRDTNTIVLEPEVWAKLVEYVARLKADSTQEGA